MNINPQNMTSPLNVQDGQVDTNPDFINGAVLDRYLAEKAQQLAGTGLLRLYNEEWYMHNGIIYQPLSEDSFYSYAYQTAYAENIILKAGQCKKLLRETKIRILNSLNAPNDESYTVFANGLFSNYDGSQLPMMPPDYFATIYVNGNNLQNMPISHPVTDAFLNTITGGDSELIALHWEFWGYVLSSDAHAKAIFLLYGASGNNGKSTELALLNHLLSPGSVDTMPLSTMLSKFGIHRIRNCRLEYSGDEGTLNLKSTQIALLKAMSGHDGMTAEVKYKEMAQFVCTCKIAISSNYNIGMAYSAVDPAFTRRLVTIPYPVSIPKEHQDPNILYKLLDERDAIVTEAFRHYLALRSRNYVFTGSDRFNDPSIYSAPINDMYNMIRAFSDQYCDFSNPDAFTSTEELYQAFITAYGDGCCKDITAFSQAFNRIHTGKLTQTRKHTSTQNSRGFTGVVLKGVM